jgi:hypothetical protein
MRCVLGDVDPDGAGLLECDLTGVDAADLACIDLLAAVTLAARRTGWRVRLLNASHELVELADFAGLADVLPFGPPAAPGSGVEMVGQPEEREESLGVEEERDPADPVARDLEHLD